MGIEPRAAAALAEQRNFLGKIVRATRLKAAVLLALGGLLLSAMPAFSEDTINDTRVFTFNECPLSHGTIDRKSGGASAFGALGADIAKVVITSGIKFSADLIKTFGDEKSVKFFATVPIEFYGLDKDKDKLVLNTNWKCIVFVKGEFGEATKPEVLTWARHRAAILKKENYDAKQTCETDAGDAQKRACKAFKSFNLSSEPEIYFEGEVVEGVDEKSFAIEARHLKVSDNQDWSLLTGRRDVLFAFQFERPGSASLKLGDYTKTSAWVAKALDRQGFALGAFDLRDARAPYDLSAETLKTKATGWMNRDSEPSATVTNGPASIVRTAKTALRTSCDTFLQALGTARGRVLSAAQAFDLIELCEKLYNDDRAGQNKFKGLVNEMAADADSPERAFKDLTRKLLPNGPAPTKQPPQPTPTTSSSDTDHMVLKGALTKKISELDAAVKALGTPNNPETIKKIAELTAEKAAYERDQALLNATMDVVAKYDAVDKAKKAAEGKFAVGKPVNLTVAFVETRSAVTWLESFGKVLAPDLTAAAPNLAAGITGALFPASPDESQAATNLIAAQKSALEAYGALGVAIDAYTGEANPSQKRNKYYLALSAQLDYKNKARLFVEKGGNRDELPAMLEVPPL